MREKDLPKMDSTTLADIGNAFVNLVCLFGLIVYIIMIVTTIAAVAASILCGSYDHSVSWTFIPKTFINLIWSKTPRK
ncbi:unnamed protein product [Allacma fusca]|uniref:Uncharacterized protein n=1 Tax=Allacma fusca TaxID=39272 RepID=A0A8J2JK08_9HEXA|nr:unnamed protein product [Allacma fusca]